MGSKARHAKHIIPILIDYYKEGQVYVEPFVGGANLIDKVPFKKRIGNDFNEYTIKVLKQIKKDVTVFPKTYKELTLDKYNKIARKPKHKWYGYCNIVLAWGSRWGAGYKHTKKDYLPGAVVKRDYTAEAYRNSQKQSHKLKGIKFNRCSYNDFKYPKNCLIYCDPPYRGTAEYKDDFDHDKFYKWCKKMTKKGHTVIISEYNMPKKGFKQIWALETKVNFATVTTQAKRTERLFICQK